MTLTATRPTTVEWSAPFDALDVGQTFVPRAAGLATFSWTIANQHGQTVCRARVEVLWRADVPAGSDDGFVAIPL
jgi:hypothetical protein